MESHIKNGNKLFNKRCGLVINKLKKLKILNALLVNTNSLILLCIQILSKSS